MILAGVESFSSQCLDAITVDIGPNKTEIISIFKAVFLSILISLVCLFKSQNAYVHDSSSSSSDSYATFFFINLL